MPSAYLFVNFYLNVLGLIKNIIIVTKVPKTSSHQFSMALVLIWRLISNDLLQFNFFFRTPSFSTAMSCTVSHIRDNPASALPAQAWCVHYFNPTLDFSEVCRTVGVFISPGLGCRYSMPMLGWWLIYSTFGVRSVWASEKNPYVYTVPTRCLMCIYWIKCE